MALFATAAVRCASVRAKGPVRVKIVAGESLEDLIDVAPEVPSAILKSESLSCICVLELCIAP